MKFIFLSDKGVSIEIGNRIKALRLRKNITQKELAQATTYSLNAIKSLESGHGKISTLVAILRELKALDQLDNFIPDIPISPLQLSKMQGKVRARASGDRLSEKHKIKAQKQKNKTEW